MAGLSLEEIQSFCNTLYQSSGLTRKITMQLSYEAFMRQLASECEN